MRYAYYKNMALLIKLDGFIYKKVHKFMKIAIPELNIEMTDTDENIKL